MKKSKIFMATGALVLAVSAIFATKANRKFAPVSTAKAVDGTVTYVIKEQTSGTPFFMTTRTGGTSGQLFFQINGSAISGMVTDGATGTHEIYYKP